MELESALLIVPPRPVQAFSYSLREEHDPVAFARMPANFTFFYPFFNPAVSDEEEPKLRKVCARFSPFEVTLDQFGTSENELYLMPADPEPIVDLHKALAGTYPDYADQEFEPHVTLGKGADVSNIPLPELSELVFTVDKIQLYVGVIEDTVAPYVPRLKVRLG